VTFAIDPNGFHVRKDGVAELVLTPHIQGVGQSVATGVIIEGEMFLPNGDKGSSANLWNVRNNYAKNMPKLKLVLLRTNNSISVIWPRLSFQKRLKTR
jgi:hypothetical protein